MPPIPFTIAIPAAAIADLKARLSQARWPAEITGGGWTYGANLAYLQELCAYWRYDFNWRAQEAYLNAMPQYTTEVDGYGVHYVHVEGKGPHPLPLVFTHGWPGTFYEVHKVLGPLTDPAAHGGDPADAFTVVVPSLPGYGFSDITTTPGFHQRHTAELWDQLMQQLGYERYAAQGGDWGAVVTARLGAMFPAHVVGAHINMPFISPPPGQLEPQNEAERAYLAARGEWQRDGQGYSHIQGTRPQTLAYGLTDSPAGLAGWIVEKWRAWSDCNGDIESRFSKDEILTNLSIYWFTSTINSSIRYYFESRQDPTPLDYIDVPVGVAQFPKEIAGLNAPRSWVERGCNLVHWTAFDRGGHFAAMEEPELLVQDVRDFFRPLR